MRTTTLLCGLVSLSLAASVSAQNFVKNGDFSADLTSWTGSGDGGSPGITTKDVTGLGTSKCFTVKPGGNVYAPPHVPYVLKQNLLSVPTILEFRMDVLVTAANSNSQGGIIDVKLGTQTIGTWQRFAGSIAVGTYHDQLCFRFQSTQAGLQDLAIEMGRPKYIWSSSTPFFYVDNVSLRIAGDPVVCMPGERKEGGLANLLMLGQPNAAVALFVAPTLLPAAVKIPGWSGALELDPGTWLFMLGAALDGNGELKGTFTVPAGIGGIPLYWQGAQITTSAQSIGNMAPINFYQ